MKRSLSSTVLLLMAATGCSQTGSAVDTWAPPLSTPVPNTGAPVTMLAGTTAPPSRSTNQARTTVPVPLQTTTTTAMPAVSAFRLTSPDMVSGGAMAEAFTCDGLSQSPSLAWSDGPTGTAGYAIAMHHIPGPGDTHWYWVVYDIPSTTHSVQAGGPAPGRVGTNSVNNQLAYAPPCSKGPGPKVYTITVYALSASPGFPAGSAVSRDQLLAAIDGITLASSSIDVTYERS